MNKRCRAELPNTGNDDKLSVAFPINQPSLKRLSGVWHRDRERRDWLDSLQAGVLRGGSIRDRSRCWPNEGWQLPDARALACLGRLLRFSLSSVLLSPHSCFPNRDASLTPGETKTDLLNWVSLVARQRVWMKKWVCNTVFWIRFLWIRFKSGFTKTCVTRTNKLHPRLQEYTILNDTIQELSFRHKQTERMSDTGWVRN